MAVQLTQERTKKIRREVCQARYRSTSCDKILRSPDVYLNNNNQITLLVRIHLSTIGKHHTRLHIEDRADKFMEQFPNDAETGETKISRICHNECFWNWMWYNEPHYDSQKNLGSKNEARIVELQRSLHSSTCPKA
ncbi:hypothetical protein AYI70_g11377 [Smittium culicis]|uniref:Uncharacterized protein n=1 Tax=Smittium culicis TaxID=133412 RepID=A0A1R1X234_9FUNG|nr:hypothetical protein AYI70_g11377 [Smittium culicis]